jgi:beta-mannosidase
MLDKITKRIGFRRVELIQEPLDDAPGTTFLFEINGVRIFIGGTLGINPNFKELKLRY